MRPPSDELSEAAVLEFIRKAAAPARLRELAHAFRLRPRGRRDLKKLVARLVHSGVLQEMKGGRYALARTPAHGPTPPPSRPMPVAMSTKLISGRLACHRDGYGFVIPDQPVRGLAGDLFIGSEGLGGAMHGDRVLARITRQRRDARAEGVVVRVLERANQTVVGQFRYGSAARGYVRGGALPFNYVIPYDDRITQHVLIPADQSLPPPPRGRSERERPVERLRAAGGSARSAVVQKELDGAIVNVEITRFPTTASPAQGRVLEVLGWPGDFGIDVEIIIRKGHLPFRFSDGALAEAGRVPQVIARAEIAERQDFRPLPIVTIDGETARDFDDAVYVGRLANGNFELQVHIADVAQYVPVGSAIDREARLRGTSVYFPDRAVPMLPTELSSGICSLLPHSERLVLSVVMEIDRHGEILSYRFREGVIRSAERMTYTDVNAVLEGDHELSRRYAALVEPFQRMKELALILNRKRQRRGSIDFDLPEPLIEFDEHGFMIRITRAERNIAHRIIEEFMLAANETVAGFLESRGLAALYRIHEKPDPRKVIEFEEIAQSFGYSLGVANLAVRRLRVGGERQAGRDRARHGDDRARGRAVELPPGFELDLTSRHYQRLVEKIEGKPEERILAFLMLRSLKQARYAERNVGHFALASPTYTHFTSPIRRYPDLIVHRVLKWALAHGYLRGEGEPIAAGDSASRTQSDSPPAEAKKARRKPSAETLEERLAGPYGIEELAAIALESSEAERRADDAERELIEWKKLEFMAERLGEEFDSIVISVTKWGLFVELTDLFIEGLVPIDSLPGDDYRFRESDRAIVGVHKRRAFRLGDRARVRVDRIDSVLRKIQFSLV